MCKSFQISTYSSQACGDITITVAPRFNYEFIIYGEKNKFKFKTKTRNSQYCACFSAVLFGKEQGFFAVHCTLSQLNPKCTTWLGENFTNRVAYTRSADRQHLSFLPHLWLPHCIVWPWLLFWTSDK